MFKKNIWIFSILFFIASSAHATPITYLDLNFEDGSVGGGVSIGFPLPTNTASGGLLDGRALFFNNTSPSGTQILWNRGAMPDSNFHYVAFDFYSERGANITHFLDVPTILRSDISTVGRHRVEFYYNLQAQSISAFLDGVLDASLVSIAAWPAIESRDIRIANQLTGPGNSVADFWIDNLVWQGNVRLVPEPGTLVLLGLGLAGLGLAQRNKD